MSLYAPLPFLLVYIYCLLCDVGVFLRVFVPLSMCLYVSFSLGLYIELVCDAGVFWGVFVPFVHVFVCVFVSLALLLFVKNDVFVQEMPPEISESASWLNMPIIGAFCRRFKSVFYLTFGDIQREEVPGYCRNDEPAILLIPES